jgi:hypothetical protein
MARWTDLATWVGTTARNGGAMANPPRGLVLHIASGFYDGTISWQARSSGSDRTSSHFIVARDGRCAQMVDTADGSWAQKSGNNTWLSIELEGFAPDDGSLHATHPGWETATPQQLEVCARLLARAHRDCGVPLQLATSPSGRGLGHHSMGAESGVDWGHSACPGTAIKNQKPAILARAIALANGQGDDDMALSDPVPNTGTPANNNKARTVEQILHDEAMVRAVLIGELSPAEAGFGPTTPLGQLVALAAAGPAQPAPVALTDDQLHTLADLVAGKAAQRLTALVFKADGA